MLKKRRGDEPMRWI